MYSKVIKSNTTVESEKYFCVFSNEEKLRYFIQVESKIKNKFLFFKWNFTEKNKVRNIKLLPLEQIYLLDFVIFFHSYENAKNFMYNEFNNISDKGIYTGELSTLELVKKYNEIN